MKTICLLIITIILGSCANIGNRTEKEEFTVDLNSLEIPIGIIELQLERSFGRLRKDSATVSYYPREDAVLLQFRNDLVQYNQFWSRDGRTAFIKALEQYNIDFNERNLDSRNSRKSRFIYGVVEGYLVWLMHRLSMPAMANMDIGLGYLFRDGAPYFVIHQGKAEFIHPELRSNDRTSQPVLLFFTRAQASELALVFDQYFLSNLVPSTPGGRTLFENTEIDQY
jgi:hypothetical protein